MNLLRRHGRPAGDAAGRASCRRRRRPTPRRRRRRSRRRRPARTVARGTPVTISGTATDTGGGVVGGVEVSTDGGTTWHPAHGRDELDATRGRPTGHGTATIKTRAVDDSGNLESPGAGVTVTGRRAQLPVHASGRARPSATPPSSRHRRGRARRQVPRRHRGLDHRHPLLQGRRQHRARTSGTSGRRAARCWRPRDVHRTRRRSGWQQVDFASPGPGRRRTRRTSPRTTRPNGHYAARRRRTSPAPARTPRRCTPADGAAGGNGVYGYGARRASRQSAIASNYWVDVVFSESVQQSTIVLTVTGAGAVAGTLGYNDSTRLATFTPSAALTAATTYTVNLSGGAKDTAGNSIGDPISWTFTTGSATRRLPLHHLAQHHHAGRPRTRRVRGRTRGQIPQPQAGYITGIRFYKARATRDPHGSCGPRAARAPHRSPSAGRRPPAGRKPTSPLPPVSANTTYVASYYTPIGHYSAPTTCSPPPVDNGPLTALSTRPAAATASTCTAEGAFPHEPQPSNYWVDVVFDTTAADTTPPTVAARTPAPGHRRP